MSKQYSVTLINGEERQFFAHERLTPVVKQAWAWGREYGIPAVVYQKSVRAKTRFPFGDTYIYTHRAAYDGVGKPLRIVICRDR